MRYRRWGGGMQLLLVRCHQGGCREVECAQVPRHHWRHPCVPCTHDASLACTRAARAARPARTSVRFRGSTLLRERAAVFFRLGTDTQNRISDLLIDF